MITTAKVHLAIQEIDSKLPAYHRSISVDEIADNLHINIDDMREHINTLHNLYYIRFTDATNKKLFLTFTGQYSRVPE